MFAHASSGESLRGTAVEAHDVAVEAYRAWTAYLTHRDRWGWSKISRPKLGNG
jgi:hypothetical protein